MATAVALMKWFEHQFRLNIPHVPVTVARDRYYGRNGIGKKANICRTKWPATPSLQWCDMHWDFLPVCLSLGHQSRRGRGHQSPTCIFNNVAGLMIADTCICADTWRGLIGGLIVQFIWEMHVEGGLHVSCIRIDRSSWWYWCTFDAGRYIPLTWELRKMR